MNKKLTLIAVPVCAALLMAGQGRGEEPLAARTAAAQKTAMDFMREMGADLQKELAKSGPAGAVSVCSDLAPRVAGQISRQTGWKVTRIGTKVRNPLLGSPDAWEQKALMDFAERASQGEDIDKMSFSEVVNEPAGKFFRYLKAIAMKPPCLACHGPESQITPEVRTVLSERYPHDLATDYQLGDLRGAISIKEPLGQN